MILQLPSRLYVVSSCEINTSPAVSISIEQSISFCYNCVQGLVSRIWSFAALTSRTCLILDFLCNQFQHYRAETYGERNIVANASGLNCTFITITVATATAAGWLRATVRKVYNLSIVGGRNSREKRLLTIVKRYI